MKTMLLGMPFFERLFFLKGIIRNDPGRGHFYCDGK